LSHDVEGSRKHLEDIFGDPPDLLLTDARYGFIFGAVKRTVTLGKEDRVHLSEMIDRVLTHRLLGPVILCLTLYLVYMFTFQGSDPVVGVFEAFFSWLGGAVTAALPEGLLRSLIVSGIIDGVGGVLGFTPLIAFMFFAIAILEDTGYMARIAFMLDRVLRGFGLHGASMLALIVSGGIAGGCAVPGMMATRTMKEPKERLVTILVTPLMNCGAKLPVYALLIGAFFTQDKATMMLLLTAVSWSMALLAAKVIRSTVLAGPSAPFVLELPPYRVPTLKALLIHTWERTWMYVKKAGTVILAISIVLWAMMTFPGLSDEQMRGFKQREEALTAALLADPATSGIFKSPGDIVAFENYYQALGDNDAQESPSPSPGFRQLAVSLRQVKKSGSEGPAGGSMSGAAAAYSNFVKQKQAIQLEKQTAGLRQTIGGRIGIALEWVFKPMGFDWRTNIALVGGFAAKEVVVSTLGTAYSLGEVNPEASEALGEKLRKEPGWSALKAFALTLFVMLYSPCFVTLVVMRKETGTFAWPLFAMLYTTGLAYCAAMVVFKVGSLLGLG
ncbi:ferrous iron transporter B, partial [Thermodesulfobacteriota bacterium]